MGLLSVCDGSFHMDMSAVVKDPLNDDVLKKKKTRGQESDTKHKKSFLLCQICWFWFFPFCLFIFTFS